jgi:excisionase family DNA binding protein
MTTRLFAPSTPAPLTIGVAAQRLGVHRETLRAAIQRGEVPACRIGRRWLVPALVVERLVRGLPPEEAAL